MRKTIITLLTIAVIALAAIAGWYIVFTQHVKAELAQYEQQVAGMKKIEVEVSVVPPPNTPKDQVLYISGSVPALGNWEAAGVPLRAAADGKYTAKIPDLLSGQDYAFKVTRGTWGTVEADAGGKDQPNHTFTATAGKPVEVTLATWIDGGKAVPGRVTMVHGMRLHPKFHSNILTNERTLIVFVPPNYDESKDRYPVLYMQDGQNLFDEATSYQGIEWRMDETAQKLITEKQIEPLIIVGVYNTEQRNAEFTPPSLVGKTPAKGDQYADFIVKEVKPFMDSRYRTQADRAHTGIGGASMGALIAMYTAKANPQTFGQLVLMSPWLKLNDKSVTADWLGDGKWLAGSKLYIEMGTEPGDNYPTTAPIAEAQQLAAALEKAGLNPNKDFEYREIEGGRHNESSWANTVQQPLLFLYAKPTPATAPTGG